MILRRYNLNYLPVLRELLRTRSVAATARTVGLGQSSVSGILAKLREIFEDDLLVMAGRRLELTAKGTALLEPTERVCLDLESLLRRARFDPAAETRRFIVATVDYLPFLMAPAIERLMAEEAPYASIHFVDVPEDVDAALARGALDVAIFSGDVAMAAHVESEPCPFFSDDMVVIASRRCRSFEGPLTRSVYESARHAIYQHSPQRQSTHESLSLHRQGLRQDNTVSVSQFLVLPYIVETSTTLALVQRRLAEVFAKTLDIEVLEPPFDVPPLQLSAYWGASARRDPAMAWLKDLLMRARPAES